MKPSVFVRSALVTLLVLTAVLTHGPSASADQKAATYSNYCETCESPEYSILMTNCDITDYSSFFSCGGSAYTWHMKGANSTEVWCIPNTCTTGGVTTRYYWVYVYDSQLVLFVDDGKTGDWANTWVVGQHLDFFEGGDVNPGERRGAFDASRTTNFSCIFAATTWGYCRQWNTPSGYWARFTNPGIPSLGVVSSYDGTAAETGNIVACYLVQANTASAAASQCNYE